MEAAESQGEVEAASGEEFALCLGEEDEELTAGEEEPAGLPGLGEAEEGVEGEGFPLACLGSLHWACN